MTTQAPSARTGRGRAAALTLLPTHALIVVGFAIWVATLPSQPVSCQLMLLAAVIGLLAH